jgi:hypothetical protein
MPIKAAWPDNVLETRELLDLSIVPTDDTIRFGSQPMTMRNQHRLLQARLATTNTRSTAAPANTA